MHFFRVLTRTILSPSGFQMGTQLKNGDKTISRLFPVLTRTTAFDPVFFASYKGKIFTKYRKYTGIMWHIMCHKMTHNETGYIMEHKYDT